MKKLVILLIFFFSVIIAQLALPSFQRVFKPYNSITNNYARLTGNPDNSSVFNNIDRTFFIIIIWLIGFGMFHPIKLFQDITVRMDTGPMNLTLEATHNILIMDQDPVIV